MNTDRRPASRLPDDPAYWQGLAARSVEKALASDEADVAPGGDVGPEPPDGAPVIASPWWRGLSDAAFMLAASALLALAGGSLLLDERSSPVTRMETHALTDAIAPDDDLLRRLMSADEPPPATAMLHLVARREVER